MPTTYAEPVLAWYARHARDLPWRAPGATPWAVLVSEFMLQQTPVARVLPAYLKWMARWPTPAALAAEPAGEAIRQWGRLGYPRRALRLHETATVLTERHGGTVPADLDALLALPGVGSYTAAAVASFAFGQRHAVLDTNVRRVLARLISGQPAPALATSVAERRLAESLLPAEPAVAARWAVAVMELGALVCTAASPRCQACPVALDCAWLAAGRPAEAPEAARRRTQKYDGTDRQCRGCLLAVLRQADAPVSRADFDAAWPGREQLERALDGLVADGLVDPLPDGRFALPGSAPVSFRRLRSTLASAVKVVTHGRRPLAARHGLPDDAASPARAQRENRHRRRVSRDREGSCPQAGDKRLRDHEGRPMSGSNTTAFSGGKCTRSCRSGCWNGMKPGFRGAGPRNPGFSALCGVPPWGGFG